jgi:hypothetical protein
MNAQDCIALSYRTKFTTYIGLLRNATSGNFSLVVDCKPRVCGALWGSGNPDISGIGMVIGYLLESLICVVLLVSFSWLDRQTESPSALARLLLSNAAKTFYENAVFFTFAIQAASIITLAKVDFGVNADGMGGFTMEIAWLVSSLTLLPLLPMVFHSGMFLEVRAVGEAISRPSKHSAIGIEEGDKNLASGGDERSNDVAEARRGQRFLFYIICWAMGFGPFFSRMGDTFGMSITSTYVSLKLIQCRRK